jgi:hypothetical protein
MRRHITTLTDEMGMDFDSFVCNNSKARIELLWKPGKAEKGASLLKPDPRYLAVRISATMRPPCMSP